MLSACACLPTANQAATSPGLPGRGVRTRTVPVPADGVCGQQLCSMGGGLEQASAQPIVHCDSRYGGALGTGLRHTQRPNKTVRDTQTVQGDPSSYIGQQSACVLAAVSGLCTVCVVQVGPLLVNPAPFLTGTKQHLKAAGVSLAQMVSKQAARHAQRPSSSQLDSEALGGQVSGATASCAPTCSSRCPGRCTACEPVTHSWPWWVQQLVSHSPAHSPPERSDPVSGNPV